MLRGFSAEKYANIFHQINLPVLRPAGQTPPWIYIKAYQEIEPAESKTRKVRKVGNIALPSGKNKNKRKNGKNKHHHRRAERKYSHNIDN